MISSAKSAPNPVLCDPYQSNASATSAVATLRTNKRGVTRRSDHVYVDAPNELALQAIAAREGWSTGSDGKLFLVCWVTSYELATQAVLYSASTDTT